MYYYNLGCCFHDVLLRHAGRPALRYREGTHGYAELSQWVDSLAELLLEKGCRKGDVIAITHNKRPLSYALMLAALRLGIPYVNIDSASPAARTFRIIEVSRPRLIFYDAPEFAAAVAPLAAQSDIPMVELRPDALRPVTDRQRERQLALMKGVDGACIAYVMFTSGSTGIPKGVAVTHQNVLHFIEWGQTCFEVTEADNFANLSPMYFDNSVFDFYVGLFSGACLTPVYRELLASPYDLVTHVKEMGCTIWFSVPSLLIYLMAMKAMGMAPLPELRCISFGGEGYPKEELVKLYRLFSSQARLVNVYGPTECTCICSAHTITEADFAQMEGLPTLGRLNQNFDYLVLDDEGNPAATGELCLIGPNVAAGYFNDRERTAASFITLDDPARFMKRMYRTGDLVREENGLLHFVGRKDNQIKHMGYRIELEEIEHALVKLPQVNQAAVLYQRKSAAYGKLIGFVASREAVDEKGLLGALSELLPEYMVPSRIIVCEHLPKNPNGKIDRQQLHALV